MSIRQREWAIFMRPYYQRGVNRVDYTGTPKASTSDVGLQGGSYPVNLSGAAEGNSRADTGGWVMYYKTNSLKQLREIYKGLIDEDVAAKHLRVAEIVNVDTMITPIS